MYMNKVMKGRVNEKIKIIKKKIFLSIREQLITNKAKSIYCVYKLVMIMVNQIIFIFYTFLVPNDFELNMNKKNVYE